MFKTKHTFSILPSATQYQTYPSVHFHQNLREKNHHLPTGPFQKPTGIVDLSFSLLFHKPLVILHIRLQVNENIM